MTRSTIAAAIGLALAWPQAPRAAGVVTACNEAGLKAALVGAGTVTFACSGTITILGGTIVVSQHTVIDGTGHKITISGGGKVQVFMVNSSGALYLTSITVADGAAAGNGGGLLNQGGFVKVTNSSFQGNLAYGGSGGGIYNVNGGLEVINSRFSQNNAVGGSGGGIYMNTGVLLMEGCEFDNNAADSGGGIFNNAPIMQVENSTFFENFGNGGNVYNAGVAFVWNATLASGAAHEAEGGNLNNQGLLQLQNTILANAGAGNNCSGSVTDGGGNLRWPASDPTCVGSYGNPKLGTLQNNGGPTSTLALLPGSAAIDTGVDALCPSTDQRGVLRPQGPHCDIGAYEANTAKSLADGVDIQVNAFQSSLLSLNARRSLSDRVIAPLEKSLNPNLWGDGTHVNPQNGSEVFTNQRDVVNTLSQILIDPAQLAYINNLVLAGRTIAVVALQDKGCGSDSSVNSQACAQAIADVAAGDASAADGNFSDAITHYLKAWQLINP